MSSPSESPKSPEVPVDSAAATPSLEDDLAKIGKHKRVREEGEEKSEERAPEREKNEEQGDIDEADSSEPAKLTFDQKFELAMKKPKRRKKKDEVDLVAMQDEAISELKNMMKEAVYEDIECVNNKKPATHKLRLLPKVKETLLKSSLYDSILDNNLLEAVKLWLEPLPDASLPSYEIQKTLLAELTKLPIKTIHLRESGLGKVIVFYQKSPRVDPVLKRTADKLISDWTRPIMGRSDNYRAKAVATAEFDPEEYKRQQRLRREDSQQSRGPKSLYQESADRRKRAAAPEARTTVYTIAPQVSPALLQGRSHASSLAAMGVGSSLSKDERFKKLNQKLTQMGRSKGAKKGGVSIEGKGVNTF